MIKQSFLLAFLLWVWMQQKRFIHCSEVFDKSSSIFVQEELHQAVKESERLESDPTQTYPDSSSARDWNNWLAIFNTFSSSQTFLKDFWQKAPMFLDEPFQFIQNHFTLENEIRESVDGTFVQGLAADSTVSTGESKTWTYTSINENPMSPMSYAAVQQKLENSTIYFNNGALLFPKLGAICLASQEAFDFPNTINVYITKPNLPVSLIPHTDKQDVFIIQTQGAKAWKVYAPPSPRKAGVDPLVRGKFGDEMTEEELGEPLLDIVLQPGQMLYIPVGFPHATSTKGVEGEPLSSAISVHLTLGIDTHIWGLSYAVLRWCGFMKSDIDFRLNTTAMTDEVYYHMQNALELGFLESGLESNHILESAVELIKKAEPERFIDGLPSNVLDNLDKSVQYLKAHHRSLTDLHAKTYSTIEVGDVISAAMFVQEQKEKMNEFNAFCSP